MKHPTVRAKGPLSNPRYPLLDTLRGMAIVLMLAFHFCFDLAHFKLADFNFYRDPFWLHSRTLIVTLFLLVMGVSLHLATRNGIRWRPFRRRLLWLGGYALLVSTASYAIFGEAYIFFGILHFIFVASLLGLLFVRYYWLNLGLGAGLILLERLYAHPIFNDGIWQISGLMTHKPYTADYVPLLPWFGVVLIGLFIGRLITARKELSRLFQRPNRGHLGKVLALAGRHSLHIYILHQPLLFALLWLWVTLFRA